MRKHLFGGSPAGASGKAYATINSIDELTVQSGAEVIANGYLRAYTGETNKSQHRGLC